MTHDRLRALSQTSGAGGVAQRAMKGGYQNAYRAEAKAAAPLAAQLRQWQRLGQRLGDGPADAASTPAVAAERRAGQACAAPTMPPRT